MPRCLLIFNWLWARKHAKPLRADFGLWRESAWLDWPHCRDALAAHAAGPLLAGNARLPLGGARIKGRMLSMAAGAGEGGFSFYLYHRQERVSGHPRG